MAEKLDSVLTSQRAYTCSCLVLSVHGLTSIHLIISISDFVNNIHVHADSYK